jgi:hypothetical protein
MLLPQSLLLLTNTLLPTSSNDNNVVTINNNNQLLLPFCSSSTTTTFTYPTCWLQTTCGTMKEQVVFQLDIDTVISPCSPTSLFADACHDEVLVREQSLSCPKQPSKDAIPLKTLPTTKQAEQAIMEMCGQMEMNGCECLHSSTGCRNPMASLVSICKDMPGMKGCSVIRSICDEVASITPQSQATMAISKGLSICHNKKDGSNSNNSIPPPMRMFLHFDIVDYVLLEKWVPRNNWDCFMACFGTIMLVILLQMVKMIKFDREQQQQQEQIEIQTITNNNKWYPTTKKDWILNLECAIWSTMISSIDLAIMLIAMTFNGYLIVSILVGVFISQVCVGHRFRMMKQQQQLGEEQVGGCNC